MLWRPGCPVLFWVVMSVLEHGSRSWAVLGFFAPWEQRQELLPGSYYILKKNSSKERGSTLIVQVHTMDRLYLWSGSLVSSSLNCSKWWSGFVISPMERTLSLPWHLPEIGAGRSWISLCVIQIYLTQTMDKCSATARTVTEKNRKGLSSAPAHIEYKLALLT